MAKNKKETTKDTFADMEALSLEQCMKSCYDALEIELGKPEKYFLVYRDKNKNNIRIDEFDTLTECMAVEDRDLPVWEGEIVRCWGRSKKELQQVYPEYRLPGVDIEND